MKIFISECTRVFVINLIWLLAIIPFSIAAANEKVRIEEPGMKGYGFSCVGTKVFGIFDFDGWNLNSIGSLGIATKSFSGYKFELNQKGSMKVYTAPRSELDVLRCGISSIDLTYTAETESQQKAAKQSEQQRKARAEKQKAAAQEAENKLKQLQERIYDNCIIDNMPVGAVGSLASAIRRECRTVSRSPSWFDKLRYQ
jgi:hypothetical protein